METRGKHAANARLVFQGRHGVCYVPPMPRFWGLLLVVMTAGCPNKANDDPPIAWKPPAEPAWGDIPKTDAEALALAGRESSPNKFRRSDATSLAFLRADAQRLVAGEAEIAAVYDAWMNADAAPSYLIFGTLHDSRAQLEAAAAIVLRMKTPWGFALEQFRAAGKWRGATPSTADDADLALLAKGQLDEAALWRINDRQARFDHAAWKFGYLPAFGSLVYEARGAGMPLFGCDMPPELRASFTNGGEGERALREIHCARALRAAAPTVAQAHATGDAGLNDDDPMPPERFAVLVGANHAEPDGLPRYLGKKARVLVVQVLGGRPRDAMGEETDLAARVVVTDPVVVHGRDGGPDMLLLPDETWGGSVDRVKDHGETQPQAGQNLPRPNVTVTSDEPTRFALGESSVDVGAKPEWISARAGHRAYIAVTPSRVMLGAVDVPPNGYVEVHVTPKSRALRIVVHTP
jgi:hypothetical protein